MRAKVPLIVLTLIISSLFAPLLIYQTHAIGCSTTCNFEADVNVPAVDGAIRVKLDGAASPLYTLNHTFAFGNNTQHTIEVIDTTLSVPSTGARYVFREWVYKGVNGDIHWGPSPVLITPYILDDYTSSRNGPFLAMFDRQFQASLTFTDPSGQAISPPTWVILQGPSTINMTAYAGQWLSAKIWTVTDAKWQSMPGSVYGSPTIDLTSGPQSVQIPLRAYSATIKVVDNSNNPVPGAGLTVTLYNNTVVTATTDSQGMAQLGHIPLGPYSVQGQNIQQVVVDASTDPVFTITLNQGTGPSAPVVSALVLLTIFGLAVFLLVLAIKVRKPPAPPTI